jgi:hypothetical protein
VVVVSGYTGEAAQDAADAHCMRLVVVKHTEAKRSIAWAARFRRLARDYERLADTLAGLHWLAFVCLMLNKVVGLFCMSS